ncbi:suppressor of fused domain protein [Hymenobacter tibetensis]|uniref:Suppressor of fused domain protein n=1 Tax=Hymenobacter tibetensis TaxID=497967 RepID=A0ABY4D289_9BACT|nr:suppressor of fused domain protein [Hymenobacter tibetensis]UOG75615.1 suppressor of fused domain protein [Hymenobacter tibetensis]
MKFSTLKNYTSACQAHYERYFAAYGRKIVWREGPIEKLHPYFYVLEFGPSARQNCWTYCTVGMSLDNPEESAIELFLLSPYQTNSVAELLILCASFHRNSATLDLDHTVNIGQPWLPGSICDHAFISLPYLHGENLELLNFSGHTTHCYWLIPITKAEREYKISHGGEALEQLFEDKALDYLNPVRRSLL